MGLNANLGGRRTPANDPEKWTFGFDRVRVLVCTKAKCRLVIRPIGKRLKYLSRFLHNYFLRIYILLDVNFQLFASFCYLDYSDIF